MVLCNCMINVLKFLGYLPFEIRIPVILEKYLKFVRKIPIQCIQNCVTFSAIVLYLLQPVMFLILKATTIAEYQESTYFISMALQISASYSVFVLKKPEIIRLFADFHALVEKRCRRTLNRTIYGRANRKIANLTSWFYMGLFNIMTFSFYILRFGISRYNYIALDFPDKLDERLPYPTWLPFDCTTPCGYFSALLLETVAYCFSAIAATGVYLISYAFCQILIAFTEDLDQSIKEFNFIILISRQPLSNKNCIRLDRKICEIIQFHGDAKSLAYEFADVYRYNVFIFLTYATVLIASALLEFQQSILDCSWSTILSYLYTIFLSFLWLYLLCNVGEEVTCRFLNIGDTLYKCSWHNLPTKLRKYFPTMIMVAQKPVYIQGMGNIRCTLERFKMVAKCGFTYFLIVRESMELQMRLYRLYRNFKTGPVNI